MFFASESCIQELLSASDSNRVGNCSDGWKVLTLENGVELSKRQSGSLHTFRSRWVLRSVSPEQFITVANAIDAAKVSASSFYCYYIRHHYMVSEKVNANMCLFCLFICLLLLGAKNTCLENFF